VFRWDGEGLVVLGPARRDESGNVDTRLSNADYVDVDGDGRLDILNPTETETGEHVWQVYRLEGGTFVEAVVLDYLADFYPPPALATGSFEVASPGPEFVLTLVNGDRDGSNRVRAGTVRLNGSAVVTPDDLGAGVRTLVRQVSLLDENRIDVTLVGDPGSHVLVTVGSVKR
jgi:hypothetical protein